jgi:vancomycin resistance protein VanJ
MDLGTNSRPIDIPPTRPTDWRRRAVRGSAILCWAYAAAVVAGFVLLRWAGDRWWPATFLLFSPRWLWAAPLLIVIPAAVVLRQRLGWLPAAAGVFALFGLLGFCIPWRTWAHQSRGHLKLRVMTCNAHARQMSTDTLEELISENNPDIIALQDFWPRRMPQALTQPGWFIHRDDELFIASRYPITRSEDLGIHVVRPIDQTAAWVSRTGAAACYTIGLPGGPITFVNLHLASAHQSLSAMREDAQLSGELLAENTSRRRYESDVIRQRLNQIGNPVILAGDFNTPDDSPLFRNAWSGLQDAFNTAGFGFGLTYARHRTALRIDHVLCDPSWTIRDCRVGNDVGSGHRVLVADLER